MIEKLIQELIEALNANTAATKECLVASAEVRKIDLEMLRTMKVPKPAAPQEPDIASLPNRTAPAPKTETESSGSTVLVYPVKDAAEIVLPAKESAPVTAEQIRSVARDILNLRAARTLIPPNAPIKALNTEYGYKSIVDCVERGQAVEVLGKLTAVLKELQS